MQPFRRLILYLTIGLVIFLAIYVAVLSLNLYPTAQEHKVPIVLTYPDSFWNGVAESPLDFTCVFTLEYNGTLAANTRIVVINPTLEVFQNYPISVYVAFPQAVPTSLAPTLSQGDIPMFEAGSQCAIFIDNYQPLNSSSGHNVIANTSFNGDFVFTVSGDYSPDVRVMFPEMNRPPIEYSYSQIKVHVASASEIQAETNGSINNGLTYALIFFAFLGATEIIYTIYNDDKREKSEEHYFININLTPIQNEIKPETISPKTINLTNDNQGTETNDKDENTIVHKTEDSSNKNPSTNSNFPV